MARIMDLRVFKPLACGIGKHVSLPYRRDLGLFCGLYNKITFSTSSGRNFVPTSSRGAPLIGGRRIKGGLSDACPWTTCDACPWITCEARSDACLWTTWDACP